jgi:hypothetical protein
MWPDHNTFMKDADGCRWRIYQTVCPACKRPILRVATFMNDQMIGQPRQVWPKGMARAPLSAEVPDLFANDYNEACLVLDDSPKASAALSRRCLQHLLREKGGVKPGKLYAEIDEAVNSGKLPPYLTESLLDAVRHFGNFAAHAEKDVNTGEVIDVEPGEAEWCLDVLEMLFDIYFVQPAKAAERTAKLQEKLKNAGKKG